MAVLRLFAAAREAAGTDRVVLGGDSVGAILAAAVERFGGEFARVLDGSRVWLNGDLASPSDPASDGDEVAVLPPVSGGC